MYLLKGNMYFKRKLIIMKRLLLLLSIILFFSCSMDDSASNDESTNYSFEFLSIESVKGVPDAFILGEKYPMEISYFRPSTCHDFKEFYFLKEDNVYTIAPINYVFENDTCETLEDSLIDVSYSFLVEENELHIFKFWQGLDENDEDQFLIVEIPVLE